MQAWAQNDSLVTIYGTVITSDSSQAIPNTHVINKTTFAGTITNGIGEFLIQGNIDDTLVFSNVSYSFYYHRITGKEGNNLIIKLKTRNYLLDEVSVNAYKLTSNDPKPMAVGEPMIPRNEDLTQPEPLAPTLGNPVDYLYYLFSRRPKQLQELKRLYVEDYYKRKLKQGNNREMLIQITGIPRAELEAFMFYCKYSDVYIRTLNDYDFLTSLLACYDQYEREKAINKVLDEGGIEKNVKPESERFIDD